MSAQRRAVGVAQTGRDVDGCREYQEPIGINSGGSDHRNSPILRLSSALTNVKQVGLLVSTIRPAGESLIPVLQSNYVPADNNDQACANGSAGPGIVRAMANLGRRNVASRRDGLTGTIVTFRVRKPGGTRLRSSC